MANSVNPDQTAPIGAVCSGSTLIASMLNSSAILGIYLHQTTSADDILDAFFLDALRVNSFLGQPTCWSRLIEFIEHRHRLQLLHFQIKIT